MATIGKINTIISTNTKPFTEGLGRASTSMKSFGGGIAGLVTKFAPLGAALGASAALFKGFTDAIGDATALGKLSSQTGASVEELSRLRAVASRLSIDHEDLTGSIEELNIRLGETIRDGTGPAAEALKQLGLDANKLSKMPLTQRFQTIAEALKGIQNQATRGFVADEIFGGDAFKILPLLNQGSDGIRDLIGEAEQLGQVMTKSQQESAAKVGQAWKTLKATGTSVFKNIALSLFDSLDPQKIQNTFKKIQDFTLDTFSMMEFGFKNIGTVADFGWAKIKLGAASLFEDFRSLFFWLTDNWKDVFKTLASFNAAFFKNLTMNAGAAMKEIVLALANPLHEIEFVWTPLLDGFESSIKKLPDIAERELTALEKQLTKDADSLGGKFFDGLADHLSNRRKDLHRIPMDNLDKFVGPKMPELKIGIVENFKDVIGFFQSDFFGDAFSSVTDTLFGSRPAPELAPVAAVERGSSESFSQILNAIRGDEKGKQDKAQKETTKAVNQAVAQLKKVVTKLGDAVQLVAGDA